MGKLRVYEVECFDKHVVVGKHLVAATKRKAAEKYISDFPSYRREGETVLAERVKGLKYKAKEGDVAIYLRQVE